MHENLCADKGYVGSADTMVRHGYKPHIRPRGEDAGLVERTPGHKPRRFVVELCHSWFNRFRKLAPRYEKTHVSYVGLVQLAASMIVLNKVSSIYG